MTDRITNIDGKVYTIDGCDGCPFYDNGDGGYGDHCQYPEKPSEHPAELCLTPPNDCPLREGPALKPCPFCGSTDVHFKDFEYYEKHGDKKVKPIIHCYKCGAGFCMPWYMIDQTYAAKKWNQRATQ